MSFTVFGAVATSFQVQAFNASVGFYTVDEKVQNRAGSEAKDPYSPFVSLGHEFELTPSWYFLPRLGYIQHKVESADHYSKYKMETIFLLYDFAYRHSMDSNVLWKAGFGTFMKQIKGQGGTVTVPNGGGTATAYRPGTSKRSSTATWNLGFDWKFKNSMGTSEGVFALSGEIFFFEPLEDKKRIMSALLGLSYFF